MTRAGGAADAMAGVCPQIGATPLQGGGRLVRDYLAGVDLSAFYTGHPGDSAAYRRKAEEVERRLGATSRTRAASAIHPLGDAAGRLHSIVGGDGFFVTTGQQPALFGGPLYTMYKILAAIRLAAVLERQLERPVLALFWVGSDDHDWDEARHATVIDAARHTRRISVHGAADAPPLPLSVRRWDADVTRAVAELAELLPATEFSDDIVEHVGHAYTPQRTVADSFTATLRHVLRDHRLAIVDAADPAVRRAAAPVLRHEVLHAVEHAAAVARQTQRLERAGYAAQVTVGTDAAHVMLHDEQGRDRLVRSEHGWATRRRRQTMTEAELLARMAAEPDSFSPNVLLRPVVESALFPTIAYVAGPAELSYFAQIGCLFAAHGILPPLVVPRPSITLVEPQVRRLLDSLELDVPATQRPLDELVATVLNDTMPDEVRAALAAIREGLAAGYERLADAAAVIDPTLRGPLTAARNASLIRAREAEKKIAGQLRRRNDVLVEQLRRVSANLYPDGAPQERVLNLLPYMARYGPRLVPAIERALSGQIELAAEDAAAGWSGPTCA